MSAYLLIFLICRKLYLNLIVLIAAQAFQPFRQPTECQGKEYKKHRTDANSQKSKAVNKRSDSYLSAGGDNDQKIKKYCIHDNADYNNFSRLHSFLRKPGIWWTELLLFSSAKKPPFVFLFIYGQMRALSYQQIKSQTKTEDQNPLFSYFEEITSSSR